MIESYQFYLLKDDFYSVFDWSTLKVMSKRGRPTMVMCIEYVHQKDFYCCIPISKDENKSGKFENLAKTKPDLVHYYPIDNKQSYLLIQNLFFVHKDFLGSKYCINEIPFIILDATKKREIKKKINKVLALINNKRISYVDLNQVIKIQKNYIEQNNNIN